MARGKGGGAGGVAGKGLSSLGTTARKRLKPYKERTITAKLAAKQPNFRTKRGAENALRGTNPLATAAADVGRRRTELLHYPRQTFTPKQRAEVWENYFGKGTTQGTDVGGRTIYHDAHRPAGEQAWQMGHVGGHEHWKNVQNAIDDGADPQAFKADYNNVANYRPEHQITNGSHQHEDD